MVGNVVEVMWLDGLVRLFCAVTIDNNNDDKMVRESDVIHNAKPRSECVGW